MTCANNCKGVNPNAVIIGGTAVLLAAAVTPLQMLTVGVGAAVAAGGGAVALSQIMSSSNCPATRPCIKGLYYLWKTIRNWVIQSA